MPPADRPTMTTAPTPDKRQERVVMDAGDIARAVTRIAHEILERNKGIQDLALVGIRTGGVHLAHRLVRRIHDIEGPDPDRRTGHHALPGRPLLAEGSTDSPDTSVPAKISDLKVVLVDDVLFTGRTIRAAMDGLIDLGRPAEIQLAVLVDRGHRQLPIKANYIGKNIPTSCRARPSRFTSKKTRKRTAWSSSGRNRRHCRGAQTENMLVAQLSADDISLILETADSFKEVSGREIRRCRHRA
ncbi:MAG: bifunctional pyr operon transcriptional regulator/uracil phosphoribosyltransferase PyrR [Nitrospira sp.]|nr:bifunctional pyr operon transcriptional regulator/uracil phosphoribosyltransferase PyrR [Nitrospira sp.]